MKYFLFLLSICVVCAQAQVQSPKQFYGYDVGERFTLASNIQKYTAHLAAAAPQKVRVVTYGQTYEARELSLVVVSSEENIKNLEQIRTDHLKSIGMMDGKPTTKTRPPFVWLSYNVHGDEAVNSEAVSTILYNLLQNNGTSEKILKNSVVIIAPCLNPDGHDRYVNWYNQKAGTQPNVTPFSWEHTQPWPGGRWTHYLFDPNRDWAWQTQEITKQLMVAYHQWMPHLHGDFHEMGVESPYYFAPSAKPFHEDITTWQREMQEIVGTYNKKAFDTQNWLYYTHERFDLFYPSYGDTWPTYNGAIAMTFEQGGSGQAGLAIERASENDTLTLKDRISHVVAASLATIESIADRPTKVVDEFIKFYEKAQTSPIGPYKGYVIKTQGDEGKVKALSTLLDKNKIQYSFATESKPMQGYSYLTTKDESFKTDAGDMVISAYQPKSTLLKILFETQPKLEDSLTYDITSWCVPLAYSLNTYGIKEKIIIVTSKTEYKAPKIETTKPYAYIAPWKSVEDAKFLATLLKNKVRVRVAEKPFVMTSKNFAAGTLIITRTGNEALGDNFDKIIITEAEKQNIPLTASTTGAAVSGSDFGSDFVYPIKAPRIGLLAGEGTSNLSVGEVWHLFDQELNYPISLIDANGRGASTAMFSKLDVLVVPSSFGNILRESMMTALKDWIRSGGRLILIENGTGQVADKEGFGLKTKKDKSDKKETDTLRVYANRERDAASDDTPGSIYKVKLDNTHPLAFGYPDYYHALVNNVYGYEFLKDGWNVGYIKKDGYVAGFAGKNIKEKIKNNMIFGVEEIGRGKVVYMANNPLFRGFWYNGKLLFANAVFMVQ
jgi:Zinc carboxypeptidase